MTAVERPATDLRHVVIAVVTYRRIDDLAAMIPVVLQQRTSVANPVTMLVIDNDPAGSAHDVVARFAAQGVSYAAESTPGIAAARNKALSECDPAALLVFIDDDEHPVAGWLAALIATQAATGAAGVAGPVLSEFESEPDEWIRAGRFFVRRRWSTGTSMSLAASNNLLLDMAQVNAVGLRFDERFGLSGGSDTMFTRSLARTGRTIVWCDEAVVIDRVPTSRLTHEWVLKRAFRTGNSDSRTALALCENNRQRWALKARSAARGTARIVAGAGISGIGVVSRSVTRRARGRRAIHRGAGIVAGAFGWVYSEYAREGTGSHEPGKSSVQSSGEPVCGSTAEATQRTGRSAGMTDHPADPSNPPEAIVGIIVVSYGSHQLIASNLPISESLSRNTRVVVVDNFYSAQERAAVTQLAAQRGWALLPMDENLGFGLAVNIGVEHAKTLGCENFLLLNPDASVRSAVIDELRLECDRNPMTMVAPFITRPDGRVWFRGNRIDSRNGFLGSASDFEAIGATGWLTGACLMINSTLWDRIGGFDPDYFLYWEDVDLSWRCWAVGGRLLVRPDLIAVHDVGGTQTKTKESDVKSTLYFYYNCRNRLVFAAKHLSAGSAVHWALTTPVQSYRILARMGRRQLVRSPRHVWAGISGSANGFAFLVAALIRRLPFVAARARKTLPSVPAGSLTAKGEIGCAQVVERDSQHADRQDKRVRFHDRSPYRDGFSRLSQIPDA